MTASLLQKEEEFRKLNEELQIRNKKLMEEFDTVMKKQDTLLKETASNKPNFDYLNLSCRKINSAQLRENRNLNTSVHVAARVKLFDSAMKENNENVNANESIKLIDVPDSVDQMGIKGMAHFYRAKIKAMQNEYDKVQLELKIKCEETRKLQKEASKLSEDKEKWFHAYTTHKSNIGKLEVQISTLTTKCTSKENETTVLRKELEQLKKDLKSTNSNITGSEVRLNRALEENEKLKVAVKIAKQEEKDLKESHRKEVVEIADSLKRLERHKTELLTAFKKQMYLIDNLKKQKAYLEAVKLSQLSENEFVKILDWKME